jgi:hypothetical protein
MQLNDFHAERQADARSRIFITAVQALKYLKYPVVVLGINADAVIPA